MHKIVFNPVISPAAWEIGMSLLPKGFTIELLDPEPPNPNNTLFTLPNIVLTPHAAGPTWKSWPKRFGNSYANIERVARGEPPLWAVPELR